MSMMTALVMVATLCTAISLFNGIVSMAHGGDEDQRASYRWMFTRVGWQALAVMFLLLALLKNMP